MTSTERMLEYLHIPQEQSTTDSSAVASAFIDGKRTDDGASDATSEGARTMEVHVTSDGKHGPRSMYAALGRGDQDGDIEMNDVAASAAKSDAEQLHLTDQWPASGKMEFTDVWMQYRENPPVLRSLSFSCRGGERIGICGRTGSGKSSTVLCLFRLVEVSRGSIHVDGIDISQIPLSLLRSKLAIIPQDPVLFTGDIRFQLDPFLQHSDAEVWGVLGLVNMADTVKQMSGGLEATVVENGDNLSQGQRQLLCIARALMRRVRLCMSKL
jgi:ABC-type multidrug transport system fused ATPase/permease subunit